MVNKVQEFLNEKFGNVRVVTIDNEVWFVADDVAKILLYSEASKITSKLEDDEKGLQSLDTLGGIQSLSIINESGFYSAILSVSKANKERYEIARDFKKWITGTVIPAIRKDGAYISGEEEFAKGEMSEDELILQAMTIMQTKIDRLKKENEEMKPKVEYHDTVLNPTTYRKLNTATEVAKDLGTSANALNKKLHDLKVIYKVNGSWVLYSDYQHLVPEYADYIINEHGNLLKWTEKGRKFIVELLNSNKEK